MDNKNVIGVVLVILIFGSIVLYVNSNKEVEYEGIKKHLSIITATIVKTEVTGYRGGSLNLYVRYSWKGVEKDHVSMTPKTDCPVIGKLIPLAIDTVNESNLDLLLKPEDFEKYGLIFPDSLNWAKSCFAL